MHCKACVFKDLQVLHLNVSLAGRCLRLALIGRLVHFKLGSGIDTKNFQSGTRYECIFQQQMLTFTTTFHTMQNLLNYSTILLESHTISIFEMVVELSKNYFVKYVKYVQS